MLPELDLVQFEFVEDLEALEELLAVANATVVLFQEEGQHYVDVVWEGDLRQPLELILESFGLEVDGEMGNLTAHPETSFVVAWPDGHPVEAEWLLERLTE